MSTTTCGDESTWALPDQDQFITLQCSREPGHRGPHLQGEDLERPWWTCPECLEQAPLQRCYYCPETRESKS